MNNKLQKRRGTSSKNIFYEQKSFIKKIIDNDGNTMFLNRKGQLHNINDQPAVIKVDGKQEWYKNGQKHRDNDKPAIISSTEKQWYQNGQKHRKQDKPAVEHNSGAKEWWQNGKRHRDGDKPAVIDAMGSVFFFKDDKRHRNGGKPAVIAADGRKKWYQNGKPVSGGIDLLDMKEPNIFYSIWFSLTNRSRIKKYL